MLSRALTFSCSRALAFSCSRHVVVWAVLMQWAVLWHMVVRCVVVVSLACAGGELFLVNDKWPHTHMIVWAVLMQRAVLEWGWL